MFHVMELTPLEINNEYRQMEAALQRAGIRHSTVDYGTRKVIAVGRREVSFDDYGWSSITIPSNRTFVRKVPLKTALIWLQDGLVDDEDTV